MIDLLAAICLAPLLIVQGLWTRRRTLRLPEPGGPRSGSAGNGSRLRLLILGDSAAAGVGVDNQSEALSGQLVQSLADEFLVDWQLEATTGHKTSDALRRLAHIESQQFDAVLISLGVNDVTGLTSLARWRCEQQILRDRLARAYGSPLIICCGLPPMHAFPALPQPLRWFLGRRARRFDAVLRADVAAEPSVCFFAFQFDGNTSVIAADGFHPGPDVYREWGAGVARILKAEQYPGDRDRFTEETRRNCQ